jgi:phosphoesterase RecJ-like protein
VNPEEIYQNIYSSKEVTHLQLLGTLLQNVKTSSAGKLAWVELPYEMRQLHGASADDTQSFMNQLLLLRSAEVVCLFREEEGGQTRVQIRSKGRVIVNRVALEFGGGGHEFAAGAAVSQPLSKAVPAITAKLDQAIDSFERFGK